MKTKFFLVKFCKEHDFYRRCIVSIKILIVAIVVMVDGILNLLLKLIDIQTVKFLKEYSSSYTHVYRNTKLNHIVTITKNIYT